MARADVVVLRGYVVAGTRLVLDFKAYLRPKIFVRFQSGMVLGEPVGARGSGHWAMRASRAGGVNRKKARGIWHEAIGEEGRERVTGGLRLD